MVPVVTAAIITGCFGIAGLLVNSFVNRKQKVPALQEISADRRSALVGNWKGSIKQLDGKYGGTEQVVGVSLKVEQNRVFGEVVVKYVQLETKEKIYPDHQQKFLINGGFLHNRFLRLDYTNASDAEESFGVMLLLFHSNGTEVSGDWRGYGAYTEDLVSGTVILEKVKQRAIHNFATAPRVVKARAVSNTNAAQPANNTVKL